MTRTFMVRMLSLLVLLLPYPLLAQGPGCGSDVNCLLRSSWNTATGVSDNAVGDGGVWDDLQYADHYICGPTNTRRCVEVFSTPSPAAGYNSLGLEEVEHLGHIAYGNVGAIDIVTDNTDYWGRFYFYVDAGADSTMLSHHNVSCAEIVGCYTTGINIWSKRDSNGSGFNLMISVNPSTYGYPWEYMVTQNRPINHDEWYRFEYYVDFIGTNQVRFHPRVYNSAGTLVVDDDDFYAVDYQGDTDRTLASIYDGTVWQGPEDYPWPYSDPLETYWRQPASNADDLSVGNNGPAGTPDNGGYYWYYSAVEVRDDGWVGPITPLLYYYGVGGTDWSEWSLGSTAHIKGTNLGFSAIGASSWAHSPVYDMGDTGHCLEITGPAYVRGTAVLKVRGSTTSFEQDAGSPAWQTYSTKICEQWRYFQVRIEKTS